MKKKNADEDMVPVQIRLPGPEAAEMRKFCEIEGRKLANLCLFLVRKGFSELKRAREKQR